MSARPISPSIRHHLAACLATLDPRCDWPEHSLATQGQVCPRCRQSLPDYSRLVPTHWPEA